MKKLTLLLVAILAITSLSAQNDKRLKGLEKEMNNILEATHAAGFSVAVVEGDKVVYSEGFGFSDYKNKIPADANTLFAIGSCTKAFTAAVLGQLRKEGELTFDDSPIKYVKELKFYNDEMNNKITIKDLMCHRTGLPRHDFSWYFFPTKNKDSLIMRIEHQEPFTGLREQWYYNNFMYLTQGVIAERITGKSWEDNIRDRFFKPLGMERSNLSIVELENSTNAAFGYVLNEDENIEKTDYYKISGMAPAGSINSSANEMAKWMGMWLNRGKIGEEEILPMDYIAEAVGSQMVVNSSIPDLEMPDFHLGNYGYGWGISSYKGHYRVEHGGNIDGFSASTTMYPTDSLGIVVLTNQGGSALPSLVRNTIADRMLGTEKTGWTQRFLDRTKKAKEGAEDAKVESTSNKATDTKPSHQAEAYTGKYFNPGYGSFEVYSKNDSLFAKLQLDEFFLEHFHYDIFEPYAVKDGVIDTMAFFGSNFRFDFDTKASGDIASVSIKLEPTLDPIEFEHEVKILDIDENTLDLYVGEYEIMGVTITVSVKNEGKLYALVPGQPEYELIPVGTNMFQLKGMDGFKMEFVKNDKGDFSELLSIQPNGTFKAIRKM